MPAETSKKRPIQKLKELISRPTSSARLRYLSILPTILIACTLAFIHSNGILKEESEDQSINDAQDQKNETDRSLSEDPQVADPVVAFYSDNQSDTAEEDENHQNVVDYILATDADPIFHAGDLMEDGTQDSLDRFNTVTATLRATRDFYAALGNNDRVVGDPSTPSQLFLDNFTFPNNEQWYSVDYGNLHFVVLDSVFSASSQEQERWLSTDLLSDNSQERITGIMYHYPTFSSSISEQLADYGVDFVIAGHNHAYSHSISDGLHYFVLSGQPTIGYMIASVYPESMSITVYDHNNTEIDNVDISNRECTLDKCSDNPSREVF